MKITKFGHCCLLIEVNGKRILTDPGSYTTETQSTIQDIDLILITHEHVDHLHTDSLQTLVANNPQALVVCNSSVAKILQNLGVTAKVLEGQSEEQILGLSIKAWDAKHAEIFEEYGQVQNTGYFINNELFYPGDSLSNPGFDIPVLAFPTAGGWANVKESINYVLGLKPIKAFPVHDGMFKNTPFFFGVYQEFMPKRGVNLILPEAGKPFEV